MNPFSDYDEHMIVNAIINSLLTFLCLFLKKYLIQSIYENLKKKRASHGEESYYCCRVHEMRSMTCQRSEGKRSIIIIIFLFSAFVVVVYDIILLILVFLLSLGPSSIRPESRSL